MLARDFVPIGQQCVRSPGSASRYRLSARPSRPPLIVDVDEFDRANRQTLSPRRSIGYESLKAVPLAAESCLMGLAGTAALVQD